MKFVRRPDLTPEKRISIAMLAMLCQGSYGAMSELANQQAISRTFLYQLMNQAILYLSLCFSEPCCVETDTHNRDWHELILLLRLEGKCSISSITEILRYPAPLVEALAKQPQFFKLFIGEALMQYPHGKQSYAKEMLHTSQRFQRKEVSPTGLLAGSQVSRAKADAGYLEESHDDEELTSLRGDRRFAWIWPEAFSCTYDSVSASLTVQFTLPKGAYATAFLEEIGKHSLRPERAPR